MNIKSTAFAALIFVGLYNILFFHVQWGIGLGIFFLFLNSYFFFSKTAENKNLSFALLSSVIGILFAFLFSFRGNEIVQFVDLVAASFFSLVSLYLYKFAEAVKFQIPRFLSIPIIAIGKSIKGLLNIFRQENRSSAIIRGLLIAFPILGILLFLLMQADPIFEKIFSLSARMDKLDSKVSEEIRQNTRLDRSTSPPLLR